MNAFLQTKEIFMNNYFGQRQQACKVLEFLQKELKSTDYICEEFKKGQVLYSVYLSDCMFAVYRNVKDNEMIYNVIRDVEKKYNAMVYHSSALPAELYPILWLIFSSKATVCGGKQSGRVPMARPTASSGWVASA